MHPLVILAGPARFRDRVLKLFSLPSHLDPWPSHTAEQAAARHNGIEARLKEDAIAAANDVKVLVFGAGDSGYLRLLRQMELANLGEQADENMPAETGIVQTKSGVVETTLRFRKHTYRLVDVSGLQSNRRKWIDHFQDVTAIAFFASVCDYDKVADEERGVNQLQEALKQFEWLCHSQWLAETSVILVLTKADRLASQLQRNPFSAHFPDYDGLDGDRGAVCRYLKARFERIAQQASRTPTSRYVYFHWTASTDTELHHVFTAVVRHIVFHANLDRLRLREPITRRVWRLFCRG